MSYNIVNSISIRHVVENFACSAINGEVESYCRPFETKIKAITLAAWKYQGIQRIKRLNLGKLKLNI